MNIQIFGVKKCPDTRKTERYFKERNIPYHFVDLTVRGLSKGELDKIKSTIGLENLMDTAGKEYAKRNLRYIAHNREELLLTYPLLLKTPIVRNGSQATVGYCPEIWGAWK
jgi:arsenate reductase (glutaredoxin)